MLYTPSVAELPLNMAGPKFACPGLKARLCELLPGETELVARTVCASVTAAITSCVHAQDRKQLNAAIVAHCEWLEVNGVCLPTSPERLGTVELIPLLPVPRAWSFPRGGYARLLNARRGRSRKIVRKFAWRASLRLRRPVVEWKPPRTLVDTVVTSLHALCALRTRERLSEVRRAARERAAESIRTAPPEERAEIRRQAKLIDLAHDDTHISRLEPSLDQLQQRLRTASRALTAYVAGLSMRQRAFVAAGAAGIAGGGSDRALARWIMVRCEALEADVAFLRIEMQGNAAAALTGHAGAADSKAWHRQRAKAKLWLKDVGAPSSLGPTLFPDSFGRPSDPDSNRQQKDRERKEIKRARKRRDSGT